MKKIALFGAHGLLGMEIFEFFSEKYRVFPLSRGNADLAIAGEVSRILDALKPEIVINSAAIADVDFCEKNPEISAKVNRDAPAEMAFWCEKNGARLVQISTDFVFDGKAEFYDENSEKNPINIYGKHKSDAEEMAQKNCSRTIIARTARLFGKRGKNFVSATAFRAKKNRKISAIADEIGNFTFAKEVAKSLENLLKKTENGIFHAVGKTAASPLLVSKKIVQILKSKSEIVPVKNLARPAARPKNLFLKNTKIPPLRGVEEVLPEFLKK